MHDAARLVSGRSRGISSRRGFVSGVTAAAVVLLGLAAPARTATAASSDAPVPITAAEQPIPDQYIVTLRDGAANVPDVANDLTETHGGTLLQVYNHAIQGFAAVMTQAQARALAHDPEIAAIQQDSYVQLDATQAPAPSWGLDRIDQTSLPLDSSATTLAAGVGVHVYVIDTGIRGTQADFGGRASIGVDEVGDGRNGDDCNGHGTHVAGTIAGTTYGVAKAASLVAVRVLDCSGGGWSSSVIAGIDWVTGHAVRPAVANLSLGGPMHFMMDDAVKNSIAAGISYTIAAGNGSGADACLASPSDVTEAIVVGATDATDARATFSNIGSCVDVFAPGVGIVSDWAASDSAIKTLSGTSMAAPHAAGVAAQYLSRCPAATPAQVASTITANATRNVVQDPGTSIPDRVLFSGFVTDGTPTAPVLITTPGDAGTHLQWTSAPGGSCPLSGYAVYRTPGRDADSTSPIVTLDPGITTYDDPTGTPGTTYYYRVGAINSIGETRSSAQSTIPTSGAYFPLTPARLLDSRSGTGGYTTPWHPGEFRDLTVAGVGGVPADAVAVVLNVTVTNPTSSGFVTVWPAGVAKPLASNLNFVAGQTTPNLVVVQVGANQRVTLFNSAGSTDLVADIVGYSNDSSLSNGALYHPNVPARLLDSRSGTGGYTTPWHPGEFRDLTVAGVGGVPADAVAVVLNVTVTNPTSSGFVTVWPAGVAKPLASNLNFVAGQTTPNLVVVQVGANQRVTLFNSAGSTDLVADVVGYFGSGSPSAPGILVSLVPARLLDSRSGTGGYPTPWHPGEFRDLTVAGVGGVPADAVAVVLNVTVTNPTSSGFVTVWPAGVAKPLASNLNFVAGQTTPNLVVVQVGANQRVTLFNSAGSTDLVADIVGYYR